MNYFAKMSKDNNPKTVNRVQIEAEHEADAVTQMRKIMKDTEATEAVLQDSELNIVATEGK